MKKRKKKIRKRIQESREDYKRRRKNKFLYLKNTEQMDNYLDQKKMTVITKPINKPSKTILPTRLKWYQRFFLFLKKLLKWKN